MNAMLEDRGDGVSDPVIEQRRLTKRINEFRTAWDIRPEPAALDRIEQELHDLHQLVRQLTTPHAESTLHEDRETQLAALDPQDLSNELLADGEPEPSFDQTDGSPLRVVLLAPHEATASERQVAHVETSAADPTNAVTELRHNLEQRDAHIQYLAQQMREIVVRIEAWLRLIAESPSSPETSVVMQDAIETVHQLLKLSEIERSIERAQLARAHAQLEEERTALHEKEAALAERELKLAIVPAKDESPMSRRCRRFLGVS